MIEELPEEHQRIYAGFYHFCMMLLTTAMTVFVLDRFNLSKGIQYIMVGLLVWDWLNIRGVYTRSMRK